MTSYASPAALAVELRLRGLLDAAAQRGYPIKVALIANEGDTDNDPEPLADPQAFVEGVTEGIEVVTPLRAPVLVVTPAAIAVGGRHRHGGELRPVEPADARALVRGVAVARTPSGDDLARSAMRAVRQVARAGGRPLPAHVPPARQTSFLAGAGAEPAAEAGSGAALLVAALLGAAALLVLGGLVVARRS